MSNNPLENAISTQDKDSFESALEAAILSLKPSEGKSPELTALVQQLSSHFCSSDESEEKSAPGEEKTDEELKAEIEAGIEAVRNGEFVVVVDSEDRENEGDLILAAEKATSEKLAFMVNETSGLICVGVQGARTDELKLPQMVTNNTESHGTAFTVSVDYNVGTTTGISAADRAATIRSLSSSETKPDELSRPGHIFPLRARPGGVLERPGHTEASVDLARLAGLHPSGAMCEITNKDGTMMRTTALRKFAKKHNLKFITIEDLIRYRRLIGDE